MAKKKINCPCGSGLDFDACCGQFISGNKQASTAEELMRSRYSAYVNNDENYLLKTWHSSTRPDKLGLEQDAPIKWIRLEIKGAQQGKETDNQGTVEFIAHYKVNGKAERLHEVSRFRKEQDRWFYLDGVLS